MPFMFMKEKKKKKFHSTCYSSVKMKHLKVSVCDLLTEFFLNLKKKQTKKDLIFI